MSAQMAYTGLTMMMKLIGIYKQTNVEDASSTDLRIKRQRWRISPPMYNILSYTNHICNFSHQKDKDILFFIGNGFNKCYFRMNECSILKSKVQHENNFGVPWYFDPPARSTLFYQTASQFTLDLDYIITTLMTSKMSYTFNNS
jgi:hypothetical protein